MEETVEEALALILDVGAMTGGVTVKGVPAGGARVGEVKGVEILSREDEKGDATFPTGATVSGLGEQTMSVR